MKRYSQHDAKTRKIYLTLHKRILRKKITFDGYNSLDKTFGVKNPKYFENKIALDAGCGNEGFTIIQLLKLKCSHVYAFDIGSDYIKPLDKILKSKGFSSSRYTLASGSLPKIPFKKKFDIVIANGVLLHLNSIAEIKKSFNNLSRLTKKKGYFYSSYGNAGGLIQEVIFPAIRNYYNENNEFKKFIDSLSTNKIETYLIKLEQDMKRYYGEKIDKKYLKKMFDEVFITFLHNYIQAPKWWSNETTPHFIEKLYKKNGFSEIKKINKFVKRENVRKYFSGFHYDNNFSLSKILYGHGYVTYIGKKK